MRLFLPNISGFEHFIVVYTYFSEKILYKCYRALIENFCTYKEKSSKIFTDYYLKVHFCFLRRGKLKSQAVYPTPLAAIERDLP